MRELIFRGKRIGDGEWIISDSIAQYAGGRVYLYDEVKDIDVEVIPETVGQFTGLTDKNGVNVFEGDIVDVKYNIQYTGVAAERIGSFAVVFDDGCFMKRNRKGLFHFISSDVCTIIGNKHDNEDLL